MALRFSDEVKVGLMIFIAIVLFILGLIWFEGYHIKKEGYRLSVEFSDVAGLDEGDPVTVAGVKVGDVQSVNLRGDVVVVDIWVSSDVRFPLDSEVYIGSIGVLGEKYIGVRRGKSSQMLADGDRISGSPYKSDIEELATSARPAIRDLAEVLGRFRSLLDEEAERDVKSSLSNISRITDQLQEVISNEVHDLGVILTKLKSISSDLEEISGSQKGRIGTLVDNFEESSEDLKGVTAELKESSSSLKNILGRIERGEGTFGKLMKEEGLYNNLEGLTRDLDELIKDFKKNPRRYIHVEIF